MKESLIQAVETLLDPVLDALTPIIHNRCSNQSCRGYHAFAGIEGQTWGRQKAAYQEIFEKNNLLNAKVDILIVGASSTRSIRHVASFISKNCLQDSSITIIDLCRTPFVRQERLRRQFPDIRFNFIQADARSMPFVEGHFNFITSDLIPNAFISSERQQFYTSLRHAAVKGGIVAMSFIPEIYAWDTIPNRGENGRLILQDDLEKCHFHNIQFYKATNTGCPVFSAQV